MSHVRADGQAVPSSYDELARHIGAAAIRIGGDDQPIIVVNGDKDIETGEADFDKRSIWKILIGGQKLARGFTVEGLTVTYYRRRTNNASTLMQMGRWFGFRKGYQDLVRLYLGREETMGTKDIDLYEAFEAICRDEETFRNELQQYAEVIDGRPQVTPAQVPPLVSQHLSWLKPTSPNKMFNAQLVEKRSPGQWEEPTAYPSSVPALRHNTALWTPVLDSLSTTPTEFAYDFGTVAHRFNALTGLASSGDLLQLLRSLKWGVESQFAPHLAYLTKITESSPAMVDDWMVLAPQHASGNKKVMLGTTDRPFSWFSRARRRGPIFGAIRDPKHVGVALRIAGALSSSGDTATEHFVHEKRGVVVLYPIVEPQHKAEVEPPVGLNQAGSSWLSRSSPRLLPGATAGRIVTFTTIDSSRDRGRSSPRTRNEPLPVLIPPPRRVELAGVRPPRTVLLSCPPLTLEPVRVDPRRWGRGSRTCPGGDSPQSNYAQASGGRPSVWNKRGST